MDEGAHIEVVVDVARHRRAQLDTRRALVIQHARRGVERDPLARWRSPKARKAAGHVGAIVCGLGAVLAGLSVGIEWTDSGDVPWLRVVFGGVLAAGFVLFQMTDRLLSLGYERIDRALAARARALLAGCRDQLPGKVRYDAASGQLVAAWVNEGEVLSRWEHRLTEETFVLEGEACLVGFDREGDVEPAFFCFRTDGGTRLVELLEAEGVRVEPISPETVEELDELRPWPQELRGVQ